MAAPALARLRRISSSGKDDEEELYALSAGQTRVGRAPGNQLIIPDPHVSAQHAVIDIQSTIGGDDEGPTAWIQDLNSTNGTIVGNETLKNKRPDDGRRLSCTRSRLRHGECILIGRKVFEFTFTVKATQASSVTVKPKSNHNEMNVPETLGEDEKEIPEIPSKTKQCYAKKKRGLCEGQDSLAKRQRLRNSFQSFGSEVSEMKLADSDLEVPRWVEIEHKVTERDLGCDDSIEEEEDLAWLQCYRARARRRRMFSPPYSRLPRSSKNELKAQATGKDDGEKEKYSSQFIRSRTKAKWCGLLKVETTGLMEKVREIMLSSSNLWDVRLCDIVFEYAGTQEWTFMDEHTVSLDMNRLELLLRNEPAASVFHENETVRYLLDKARAISPMFPSTVPEFRKYKRPVPPRFALSLGVQTPAPICSVSGGNVKISKTSQGQSLQRQLSYLPKMLQRSMSEGWEQHNATLDIEGLLADSMRTSLHHYQKRTLMWAKCLEEEIDKGVSYVIPLHAYSLMNHEKTSNVAFHWEDNSITLKSVLKQPVITFSGGIIANEMGLGKTLTAISLTVTSRAKPKVVDDGKIVMQWVDKYERIRTPATLVACPSHLAKQWSAEIKKHVKEDAISNVIIITSIGEHRVCSIQDILTADFVVISVQLLQNPNYNKCLGKLAAKSLQNREAACKRKAASYFKHQTLGKKSPLLGAFYFERVLLDEGHEIFSQKQAGMKVSIINNLSCIHSKYRWYLSGTPFTDCLLTPRGALRFIDLRINGKSLMDYEKHTDFEITKGRKWKENISEYNESILHTRLGVYIDKVLFNRLFCRYTTDCVKGAYEVPDYENIVVKLPMHMIERCLYELNDGVKTEMLRRAAAHPSLLKYLDSQIGSRNLEQLLLQHVDQYNAQVFFLRREKTKHENEIDNMNVDIRRNEQAMARADVSPKDWRSHQRRIAGILRLKSHAQREIVKLTLKLERVIPILDKLLESKRTLYEKIRAKEKLDESEEFKIPTDVMEHLHWSEVLQNGTKIAYVLSKLAKIFETVPDARIILFSNFNSFLKVVQDALREKNIRYVLCTGNIFMRNKAIDSFNRDDSVKVIMLSLESAASGANLQQATHVILMEPPPGSKEEANAIESQAIGRAHRQGQTKKLTVIRLVMTRSIEEELLERQDETAAWRRI